MLSEKWRGSKRAIAREIERQKINSGDISMEKKEIAKAKEKCDWEKGEEKGQKRECEQ